MTVRSAFIKWSLIGSSVAAILIWTQTVEVGGIAGLLQVGEANELRPLLEEELGDDIPLADGTGHDGQIFYAMGLDLNGDGVAALLDHGAYRYRRILYPWVASLGGLLDGYALLWGMIVIAAASMGLAAGAIAALAARFGGSDWFALAVLLNPGIWLSVRLLTGDVMALGAMTLGLVSVVSGWRYAAALFTASGLAKDVYLLTPAGLTVSRLTRRWSVFVIPATALIAWAVLLIPIVGDSLTGRGNLSWPFQGIAQASSNWSTFDIDDVLYVVFALLCVAAGVLYGVFRRSWLRWPILGWSTLAIVSSSWVWDLGNNAARAFAPIVVLIAAAEAGKMARSSSFKGAGQEIREPGQPREH